MAIADIFMLNANAKTRLLFQSISFLQVSQNSKDCQLVRKDWWLNASRASNIIFLETNKDYTISLSFKFLYQFLFS